MNVAVRTLFRRIMFRTNYTVLLVRTTCTSFWIRLTSKLLSSYIQDITAEPFAC